MTRETQREDGNEKRDRLDNTTWSDFTPKSDQVVRNPDGTKRQQGRNRITKPAGGVTMSTRTFAVLDPAPRPEESWQAAYDAIERGDYPFTESYRKRVLISMRAAATKFYGQAVELSQLSADFQAFNADWKKRGDITVADVPLAYRGELGSFLGDLTRCRSALEHFSGDRSRRAALREQQDDWWELETCLQADVASGVLAVHEKKLIALSAIRSRARIDHRQPQHLSREWLTETLNNTPAGKARENLIAGAKLLDDLRVHGSLLEEGLLPEEPISTARPTRIRRKSVKLTPRLEASVAKWLAEKRTGKPRGAKKRSSGKYRADDTIKSARDGAEWYVSGLVELGKINLDEDPTPETLANPEWIKECVAAELDGRFYWNELKPSSIIDYFGCAIDWLKPHNSGLTGLGATIRADHDEFEDADKMSPAHQEWCKTFRDDPNRQRIFFSLPTTLQQAADKMLRSYNTLSAIGKAQALELAVAAAMAAILTSFPLRSRSLQALTVEGPDAHVLFPGGADREILRIKLPKRFVKNRREIDQKIRPKRFAHPRNVIEWFCGKPRTLLMTHHMPRLTPDPSRLFCGLNYARLNTAWSNATNMAGVPMTQHLARHAIATFLINKSYDNIPFIAALLRISFDRVKRSYAFLDEDRLADDADQLMVKELDALPVRQSWKGAI